MGREQLLTHALKVSREWGDNHNLAEMLRQLPRLYLDTGLYKKGIQEAKEASVIYARLGNMEGQVPCLIQLSW